VDITVSSRESEISAALRSACESKLARLSKYVDDVDRAEVHFFEASARRTDDREVCEITVERRRDHVRAKVAGPDQFVALDRAVQKIEHQLQKAKDRRDPRSSPRREKSVHSRSSQNGLDTETDDDGGPREVGMSERGGW
jgi:ribosomal subunit interface protein